MFAENEFYKKYQVLLAERNKKLFEDFCIQILDSGVKKFTVVLGNPDRVAVYTSKERDRVIKNIKKIDTIFGLVSVEHTRIEDIEYSDLHIAYIKPNYVLEDFITEIKEKISRCLPLNLEISKANGSMYAIVTRGVIGKIWNIHNDPNFVTKVHLNLTQSNERFVWYKNDEEVSTLKMQEGFAYALDVQTFHTAFIDGYINDTPRLHIVADIIKSE